jgi:hypothetical protein
VPSGLDSPPPRLRPREAVFFLLSAAPARPAGDTEGRPPRRCLAQGTACSSKRPRGGPECRVACNSVAPAAPLPSHGCRSGTGSDRARADAYTSSAAAAPRSGTRALASGRRRARGARRRLLAGSHARPGTASCSWRVAGPSGLPHCDTCFVGNWSGATRPSGRPEMVLAAERHVGPTPPRNSQR